MVFIEFILLGKDGLFSGQFHLDFLFLDVLDVLNFVPLFHFSLPASELRSIFQTHFHLCHFCSVNFFFFVNQGFFPFECSNVQLNISLILCEVRDGSWLEIIEFMFFCQFLFPLLFDFIEHG
jgi:hypothetical protein